jgi:hypothetical protein
MQRQRRQRLWGNRSRRPYGLIDGCFPTESISELAVDRAHRRAADAHDPVDVGSRHRIVVALPD